MEKEDVMIELLRGISDRLSRVEQRQADDKKELIDRISSFETNTAFQLTTISNSIAYERTRVDVIYDERKDVTVHWSNKLMAMNSMFAGVVAFVV